MGMHEWSYSNDYSALERRLVPHVSLKERFKKIDIEVELGFTAEQAVQEVQRCLNCDVQTVFDSKLCIECDACIDICPVDCLTMTPDGEEAELRTRLKAPALNVTQALYVSSPLKFTGRVMVKDEDVCVHCGLCAERCPTAAWDMQKSWVKWPHAVDQATKGVHANVSCLQRFSYQRFRHQDCHCQRNRIRERQYAADEINFP
jgi:ferredoxin